MKTSARHTVHETKSLSVALLSEDNHASILPYKRFFYTGRLLHSHYHHFIMRLNQTEILQKFRALLQTQKLSDYDFGRLVQRIERWNRLEGPFPALYLDFLGISPEALQSSQKEDMHSFRIAMLQPAFPKIFLVDMPSGSINISLPAGVDEQEALDIVRAWQPATPYYNKYIPVDGLRTTVIQPDGHQYRLSYPPLLTLRNGMYIPYQTGECYKGRKIP